jgi:hypothetical protein
MKLTPKSVTDIAGPEARQESSPMETMTILRVLGFQPEPGTFGLTYDFGNLSLTAVESMIFPVIPAVILRGVLADGRRVTEIAHSLPVAMPGAEIVIAHLTWCLDQAARVGFHPVRPVWWLVPGRAMRGLLPAELTGVDR